MPRRSDARFHRRFSVNHICYSHKSSGLFLDTFHLYLLCRFTACLSLLKWLVDKINNEGENAVRAPTGTVPLKALEFAIKRGSDYISAQSHEDIDQEVERVWAHQWDQFISWYYQIIHGQALFVRNNVPFQVRNSLSIDSLTSNVMGTILI